MDFFFFDKREIEAKNQERKTDNKTECQWTYGNWANSSEWKKPCTWMCVYQIASSKKKNSLDLWTREKETISTLLLNKKTDFISVFLESNFSFLCPTKECILGINFFLFNHSLGVLHKPFKSQVLNTHILEHGKKIVAVIIINTDLYNRI